MNRRSFLAGLGLSPLVACAAPAFAEKAPDEHLRRAAADAELAKRLSVPVLALDDGAVVVFDTNGKLSIRNAVTGIPLYDPRAA